MDHTFIRRTMRLVAIVLAMGFMAMTEKPATLPASVKLADLNGVVREPLKIGENRGVVVVFIRTDCPISNAYAPQIQRLVEQFSAKGISFYLAYPMKDLPVAEAREHAKQYGFNCPAMIDRHHELVKALGATVTPEVFVLAPGGKIAYRGRIDDLFVGLGRQKNTPTTHELRDALDAVAAGREPGVKRAAAVGCAITED